MSSKITDLTEQTAGTLHDDDVFVDVDVSDTTMAPSGTDKKSKWSSIKSTLKTYFDTLYTSGKVAQLVTVASSVVATSTANVPNDGTPPQASEMTAYPSLDITITPTNASSTLVIDLQLNLGESAGAANTVVALFKDSDASASTAWVATLSAQYMTRFSLRHIITADSTSAQTFKVYFGCLGGTGTRYINRSHAQATLFGAAAISNITVVEYRS